MKREIPSPPAFFLRFFRWFCHPAIRSHTEGDLVELYHERLRESGKWKADFKFIGDVFLLFRPGIIRPLTGYDHLNNYGMFKSYFRIAWRNLLRNKVYSSINIVGLGTGIAVSLLIGLWIWDEVSFDSYFQNRDRIARVMLNQSNNGETYTGGTIAMPLGDALRTQYANEFRAVSLASWDNDHVLAVGDKRLSSSGMWVQRDFPEMFTLVMLAGSRDALKDPSTILLSGSLAKALFGDTDPLNKSVRVDNKLDMNVGGVYEDLPHNTTFYNTTVLLPWDNQANWMNTQTDWMNHCGQLYVQLHDHVDLEIASEKIKGLPTPYIKEWKEEVMLYPISKLHLYNEFKNAKAVGGRIEFVLLFSTIGLFVLLLACINFMNLSTARSEKRAKEVGIRKTIGSLRGQLIGQFLSESIVMACLAFMLSLVLVQVSLPFFNSLADKQMSIPWNRAVFWALAVGFTFFTGIISGSYPAFYLSSFKPVKVLKGVFRSGRFALLPRKVLVVTQFTVSVALIIGTIIVFRQIQYAKERPAGYSRSGLITVNINTDDLASHYDVIRNEILQSGAVENIARSSLSAAHFGNNTSIDWEGKDPGLVVFFRYVTITSDFGKTIGWTVKEGRDLSSEIASDSAAVLLNETAAKLTGFKNPVGEKVTHKGTPYVIAGVVNDMVTQSPYEPIEPAIFFLKGWLGVINMRINPAVPVSEALAKIEPVFRKYNPGSPFEFNFVDEVYGRKFSDEERFGNLASFFTILAIFISCLGLFGLSSFVAEQRTKEIGIRKVLGASVADLWNMLSKDFVVLIIISLFIAAPLAYYFMNNWLQHYTYRTEISWWIFVLAGMGLMLITLLTVSYQALKAAVANPVKSLRSE
jgi:putative ABC transport system permease protein